MQTSNDTTVGAGTAGTAFGSLVGIGLAAATGAAAEVVIPLCATLGSFAFGRIFPR